MDRSPIPRRSGPRPLPLHLAIASTTWLGSSAALTLWNSGSPNSKDQRPNANLPDLPWHREVSDRAKALQRDLANVDRAVFAAAVDREARRRLDEFEVGLRRYRAHGARRALAEAPTVWCRGTTKLLDYSTGGASVPVLVVPSLVNRAYVLDISARRSLMRFLAGSGLRPFMVDWEKPGEAERAFTLTDYVARLETALDRVREQTGAAPVVLGYCMGGLLALALAQRRQTDVAGLALLATPWDFHADRAAFAQALVSTIEPSLPLIERMGEMPVDLLQTLFMLLDPFLAARKFRGFAKADPASEQAAEFVALEDWINDGVPLAAGVARECLLGWYGANSPGRGEWRVAGAAIRPERVSVPSLVVVPEQDRIVPPESAAALARALPNVTVLRPPLGHIGMVVGGRARKALWEPLADWLAARKTAPL